MRTTIRVRDELLAEAKAYCAREGRTLTSLVEEGLREVLARRRAERAGPVRLPVSRARGGVQPGVDVTDSAHLRDIMDGV